MVIPVTFNTKNKFAVARCHYSCDPEKNTPEWIEKAKVGISEKSWLREYEISYETFEGKPVYPEFKEDLIQSFDYVVGEQQYILRGWDFGYHHPFMVVAWINKHDQLCFRDEIMGQDEGIKAFGQRCLLHCQEKFPNAKWLSACDPAGHQKSDKSEFTSVEVLNGLNEFPISKPSSIDAGIEILRQRMMRRNDGRFGMMIHPDCKIIIDGFKGGYRYAEMKDGQSKEEPLKDGYYDHGQDAARYLATNFLEVAPTTGNSTETSVSNSIMNSGGGWAVEEYLEF